MFQATLISCALQTQWLQGYKRTSSCNTSNGASDCLQLAIGLSYSPQYGHILSLYLDHGPHSCNTLRALVQEASEHAATLHWLGAASADLQL
jgi:hypothetical protein